MARFFRFAFSVLVCLLLITAVMPAQAQTAQPTTTIDYGEIDAYLKDLMATYDVAGMSIALVKNDQVIYTKGYGFRNVDAKEPATDHTLFGIGSVTKSFTVLDVLQLVDEGKLDLNAPVVKYLPDFKLADPEMTKTVTIRQLISHSSGLPRADNLLANPALTRKQVVADMVNIKATAKPGEVFQYCNQNFVLAGYLAEQISGQSWEAYTQQHILDPLGMKDTGFSFATLQKAPDHSQGYILDVLKGVQNIPFAEETTNVLNAIGPAGSITSNALDMAQYVRFQLGSGAANGAPIVSPALFTEMHHQQIGLGGKDEGNLVMALSLTSNMGYGFGWFTESYRGYDLIEHGGEVSGFTSNVTLVPSAKVGVVILTNLNSATLFTDIARLYLTERLLGLKPEQDLSATLSKRYNADPAQYHADAAKARNYKADPASLKAILGDYDGVVGKITVAMVGDELHLTVAGPAPQDLTLIPFEANHFLANTTPGIEIKFSVGADGTVTMYQGDTQIAQRQAKTAPETVYKDPKGRFSVPIPSGLTLTQTGDTATLHSTEPAGVFMIGAAEAGSGDLLTSVTRLLKQFDPSFNLKPINVRDIPLPDGLTWTQYLYQLPNGELLAVVAVKQGDTVYFITAQAKTEDIAGLTPKFNALILNFKIGAPASTF